MDKVQVVEKSTRWHTRPLWRALLMACLAGLLLMGCRWIWNSFSEARLYKKDFASGYLLARAFVAGVDPYQPLPQLAQRFGLPTDMAHLNHPTPHPVAIGWLCLPFAWLPFPQAAFAWLLFEICCLGIAVRWLLICLGIHVTRKRWLIGMATGLGWGPVFYDLYIGQLNLVLLVLWLGVWRALQQQRETIGGALLGVMLTLKLTGWPVILWLAWRKRWRGVLAAGGVALTLHLLAIALHGWGTVQHYYTVIGPQLSNFYRTDNANLSLWTFGVRLFGTFGFFFVSQSPWQSPLLAQIVGLFFPVAAILIAVWWAGRLPATGAAFALLTCVSLLVNPIAWAHYLIVTVIPLGLILQRLHACGWPQRWGLTLLLTTISLSLPQSIWALLAITFSGTTVATDGRPVVPFLASWLTVIPTFGVIVLSYLLCRVYYTRN